MPEVLETPKLVVYPNSDSKPMAESMVQYNCISMIKGGADELFADDPNVLVAGDLLWYPVEGEPQICAAPDTLVVFGRPKFERGSYKQWEEGDIAPQVVFEVLSESNTPMEMLEKLDFYDTYGVEEYYLYDPFKVVLQGWRRQGTAFLRIRDFTSWVSPRLKVRFEVGTTLTIIRPDGQPFLTYLELVAKRRAAEQLSEQERQRAEQEHQRAERLAAQLRALGQEPSA